MSDLSFSRSGLIRIVFKVCRDIYASLPVCVLATLLFTGGAFAQEERPIKTFSVNIFTGGEQRIRAVAKDGRCVYDITSVEKRDQWHGLQTSLPYWEFIADRKVCGPIVEEIHMPVRAEKITAPMPAGSVFFIYPEAVTVPLGDDRGCETANYPRKSH